MNTELKFNILGRIVILNDQFEVVGLNKEVFKTFITSFTHSQKMTKNLNFSLNNTWREILEYFSHMAYSPQVTLLTPLEPVYIENEIIREYGILQ